MQDVDDVFDPPDEEEKSTVARRQFTYSPQALQMAARVQRVFVAHPAFKLAMEGCDRIFQLSRELNVQQGAVIAGPTGVGKTALIRYFRATIPSSTLFEPGLGALALRIPRRPNVGQIISGLLRQLKYPFPVTTSTLSVRRDALIEALRHKGTRLIFADEADNLRGQVKLRSRLYDDGTSATDVLRELMDEVPLGLCLCGSDDLLDLRTIDMSLGGRVSAKFELREFGNDGNWRGFVRVFRERCTEIDLSIFDSEEESGRLHRACCGNPRTFKRFVTEAVLVAVDAGALAVQPAHLVLAFERTNGTVKAAGGPYAS
jgi:energy-coupling factor transporter ATP-binding protein EcfA2